MNKRASITEIGYFCRGADVRLVLDVRVFHSGFEVEKFTFEVDPQTQPHTSARQIIEMLDCDAYMYQTAWHLPRIKKPKPPLRWLE